MLESMIEKWVDAFSISPLFVSEDGKRLYFLRQEGNARFLCVTEPLAADPWSRARRLLDYDFANGTFYTMREDVAGGWLYCIHDPSNREYTNVWRVHVATGRFERITNLTNVGFIDHSEDFKRGWFKDQKRLEDGTFLGTVYEIDLTTLETKKIVDDAAWTDRFGWGVPVKLWDREQLLIGTDWMNQRKKQNILLFDLQTGAHEKLLPESWEELEPRLADHRITGDRFLFRAEAKGGYANVYEFDLRTRSIRVVTEFDRKMESATTRVRPDGSRWIEGIFETASGFEFIRVDSKLGELGRWPLPASGHFYQYHGDEIWLAQSTATELRSLVRRDLTTLEVTRQIPLATAPRRELEHFEKEKVKVPSFDGLEIPALLLKPRGPLKGAIIIAFYGGGDYFDRTHQMFGEQGFAVLSPAVRGSWGYGYDWEKKLEGDLGGAEILDVIECARWVEKKLGLPSSKVGLYGSSHGGYATLRALTMPERFRGINARYPFGFAIAEAGFADLVDFFKTSRIADWLVNLLGPFDEMLYAERSPVNFFENLEAPLLVINGTDDTRVPYSTMSGFVEKLKKSGKPHRLLIHEGQGHHPVTRQALLEDKRVTVEFLRDFVLEKKA